MKKLVVNADDFGFTRDVNQGIIAAHRNGILTATTLMATGAAFDDAVRLAKETPSLDIGCHLVLVDAPPFPPTIARLIQAVALGRIPIYDELVRQVRRIVDAGLAPTHLDTHKHTHLLPPVLDAVARISGEFRIPWVRRLPAPFRGRLDRKGCRLTDRFWGFRLTGRMRTEDLVALIRAVPEGSTELMCHPGLCGEELRAARTRLKKSREEELRALTSPEVRAAIADAGVELVSYRDL